MAEKVGLSTEMLREFRSVMKLTPDVRKLVANRTIDSVDLVYRISKLDAAGQKEVVRKYLEEQLSGDDVRVISSYTTKTGKRSLKAIEDVVSSRNIQIYVLQVNNTTVQQRGRLVQRIKDVVRSEGILNFSSKGSTLSVELSKAGQKRLREEAKRKKKTLRQFVSDLINDQGWG